MRLNGKQPMVFGDQSARFSGRCDDLMDVVSRDSTKATTRRAVNCKKKTGSSGFERNYQPATTQDFEHYKQPNELQL